MKSKQGAKRSFFRRVFGLGGLSSTMLFGSAAIAAGGTLVYTAVTMPESLVAQWLIRPLAVAGLVTVGDSAALPVTVGSTTSVVAPTPTPTPNASSLPLRPTKLGVNLNPARSYEPNRIFMNLLSGGNWRLRINNVEVTSSPPPGYFDADNNLLKIATGDNISRSINRPTAVLRGSTEDIICRWTGTGTFKVQGSTLVKNISSGPGWLRFTYLPASGGPILVALSIDASDPPKNMDCREAWASRTQMFDPTYVANLKKYNTIRFMDWQKINDNAQITWANRTLPSNTSYQITEGGGYPIEYMIQLANETHTNPWFCMPWNADDDYIRRFAQMVHDNLDPKLTVYVENSNEVWNWAFPVTTQARDEGKAEGLGTNDKTNYLRRYAEKTSAVMDIWSGVFAGEQNRLVRVAGGWAAAPNDFKVMLDFRNTASKIDAVAIAPYFGNVLTKITIDPNDLTNVFTAIRASLDQYTNLMTLTKAVADSYGKRMVTYEGGQNLYSNDVNLLWKVSHDPRMGTLYSEYLARWQSKIGDLNVLFNDVFEVSQYGAWGIQDYLGQPLSKAPKALAVSRFIASINNRNN